MFLSFLAKLLCPGRRVAFVGFEELSSLYKTNSFFSNVRAEFGSHCLSFPVLGFVINWDFCFVLFFFLAEEIKCGRPLYGGLDLMWHRQQSQEVQVMPPRMRPSKNTTPTLWNRKYYAKINNARNGPFKNTKLKFLSSLPGGHSSFLKPFNKYLLSTYQCLSSTMLVSPYLKELTI